jgi:hypothetical protein
MEETAKKQGKDKEITARKILSDFKRAYEFKKNWLKEAKEDIEFALGKQWDQADVDTLKSVNVRALTINKIQPNIFLLTGIESQNRSDYHCFPEGEEDSVKADIATALMKNVMKNSGGEYKQSEQFEECVQTGECFLEPYLDYTYDIINPKLQWKKSSGSQIFPAPKFQEYDLSDAPYVCKLSVDLSRDDILQLFPDDEKTIDGLSSTKIDLGVWNILKDTVIHRQGRDYPTDGSGKYNPDTGEAEEPKYDLLEYYYKKMVKKPYIIDKVLKKLKQVDDEEMAQKYAEIGNSKVPGSVDIAHRMVPEIWVTSLIGTTILSNDRSWCYPRWKTYPIIPLYAYRSTADIENSELLVQGIVRGQKDLNRDYNKRATQELRHLNASANSGWQVEDGSLTSEQEDIYKQYGSTPGVLLKHKAGKPAPSRIEPVQFSQGHYQLTIQRGQEMKESSGINTDLLAMNESSSSGKAIAMRQKQGLVMVQKLFDNNSRTKKIMGKFILSQLSEVFDVEKALKVMGDNWIKDTFGEPIMNPQIDPMTGQPVIDPQTGQPGMVPVMNGSKPELQMTPNSIKMAQAVMNEVLNDPMIGDYDISVGEGVNAETTRYGNYLMLQEMARSGVPVPPDVLVAESDLSDTSKEKIRQAIEKMQSAAMPVKGA